MMEFAHITSVLNRASLSSSLPAYAPHRRLLSLSLYTLARQERHQSTRNQLLKGDGTLRVSAPSLLVSHWVASASDRQRHDRIFSKLGIIPYLRCATIPFSYAPTWCDGASQCLESSSASSRLSVLTPRLSLLVLLTGASSHR
jgi:hypothetical protein